MDIVEIQSLMQRKKVDEAYDRLVTVQTRYPKIRFLDFIKASLLLLKGDRAQALAIAESALLAYPNYAEGKHFVEALKGKL